MWNWEYLFYFKFSIINLKLKFLRNKNFVMLTSEVLNKIQDIKSYINNLWIDVSLIENEHLMLQSFVHKSYAADFTQAISYNERLEFLWDAILWAIIAKFLFTDYPEMEESKLTLYKIALVREETLSLVCRDIMLDKMLFLWKWEERSWGRTKNVILCDALEALIWYIYIDMWIQEVEKFIKKYIYVKLDTIMQLNVKSYKSILQEYIQQNFKELPIYQEHEFEKDDKWNVIIYKSEVSALWKKLWEWFASNKKKAQEDAAKMAFEAIKNGFIN